MQNFSLALRELVTNVAKYGALSNGKWKGRDFVDNCTGWKNNRLKFKWQERGGPPTVAPTRRGFGTSLLKAMFAYVRIDYLVEGLTCEIDLLLGDVQKSDHDMPGIAVSLRKSQ